MMDDMLQNLYKELSDRVILTPVIFRKDLLNLVECFELLNLQKVKIYQILIDFHGDFIMILN